MEFEVICMNLHIEFKGISHFVKLLHGVLLGCRGSFVVFKRGDRTDLSLSDQCFLFIFALLNDSLQCDELFAVVLNSA